MAACIINSVILYKHMSVPALRFISYNIKAVTTARDGTTQTYVYIFTIPIIYSTNVTHICLY